MPLSKPITLKKKIPGSEEVKVDPVRSNRIKEVVTMIESSKLDGSHFKA
jgi:hypothetical protein